jgi:hypothetical protein
MVSVQVDSAGLHLIASPHDVRRAMIVAEPGPTTE